MNPVRIAQFVKTHARALGFDRVGVAPAGPATRASYYKGWLMAGYGGEMAYLSRNVGLREDVRRILPEARSVICLAVSYNRRPPQEQLPASRTGQPTGRVAAYARGRDYHFVLRRLAEELVREIRGQISEDFSARICVDTAPLLERDWAAAAGIGWVGKNTCILDRRLGSYLLLAEILTSLEIEPDRPVSDHCGRCTRCISACPTQALRGPHELDARRCISYLTIEHRAEIPEELASRIADWVYGCDICQQVCPYNRNAPPGTQPEVMAEMLPGELDLLDLVRLRSSAWRRLTAGTAATRAPARIWRRNAAIALRNAGVTPDPPANGAVPRSAAGAAG